MSSSFFEQLSRERVRRVVAKLMQLTQEEQDRVTELMLESGQEWGTDRYRGKTAKQLEAEWRERDPLRRLLRRAFVLTLPGESCLTLRGFVDGETHVEGEVSRVDGFATLDEAIAAALKEVEK